MSQTLTNRPHIILKEVFGYDTFRQGQEEIIQQVLSGGDTLVLMPTGGGKSLCYQIPALCMDGTAVVVSPLIALMKDQVDALRLAGVNAAFLNSTMNVSEQNQVFRQIKMGEIKLLYVAPERFNEAFYTFLDEVVISFVAIDEAHCLSHWGHDFRPDYLSLSQLKNRYMDIPIIALTATADHQTRNDIVKVLQLRHPRVFIHSFDRPNIKYWVRPKQQAMDALVQFLDHHKEDCGIIYCLTRKSTEQIATQLNARGFDALPYHAGLDNSKRQANQDAFQRDEVKIIVATIAFGMGIDKPNVRFVIHMDVPKNMESYYQETGRAGRDGEPSEALLFYTYGDIIKLKKFIEIEHNPSQNDIMLRKLDQMASFANSAGCRRKYILNYFGEQAGPFCGNCDICLSEVERVEATVEAQKVMSAVVRLEERFGMSYVADVLKGSSSKKIWDKHKQLSVFGVGAELPKSEWMDIIRGLIEQDLLQIKDPEMPTLSVSEAGWRVLKGDESYYRILQKIKIQPKEKKVQQAIFWDGELFELLRKWRKSIADANGVPPFVILADSALKEMAAFLPTNEEELLRINGIGKTKLDRYGEDILEVISRYMRETGTVSKMDEMSTPEAKKQKEINTAESKPKKGKSSTSATALRLLELARAGMSLEDILSHVELSEGTIVDYLALLIEKGEIEVEQFVSINTIEKITNASKIVGVDFLKPIKESLDDPDIT
jgi:ATP-dependent DNA helicase RecQ